MIAAEAINLACRGFSALVRKPWAMNPISFVVAAPIVFGIFQIPAQAQRAAPEEAPEEICTAVSYRWVGSDAERERILENPVPDSFRHEFNDRGCARFQLSEESLLDWHLKYGNEQSARAALQFLEGDADRIDPKLLQSFTRHWEIATRDIRKALDLSESDSFVSTDWQYLEKNDEYIRSQESVVALIAYKDKIEQYDFLANEYTRAAEFYISPALVRGARRFQEATYIVSRFLDEQGKADALESYLLNLMEGLSPRLRMSPATREISLAVTNAASGRDTGSIAAADALTRARYAAGSEPWKHADLLTFLRNAYVEGKGACGADLSNSIPGYQERCEINGFPENASKFWFQRSRLELIARNAGIRLEPLDRALAGDWVTHATIDLFQRRDWEDGNSRYGERAQSPEIARLLILSADATARSESCATLAADRDLREAFDQLIRAQAMVNPSTDPRAYRPIAEAVLRHHEVAKACGRTGMGPAAARAALISRSFLGQYRELLSIE